MTKVVSVLFFITASAFIFSTAATEAFSGNRDNAEIETMKGTTYSGESFIEGARPEINFGHFSFNEIDPYEEELQKAVQAPGGPEEVFALFNIGQITEGNIILQIHNRKGDLNFTSYYGAQKFETRTLSLQETANFKNIIAKLSADKLSENIGPFIDDRQYEYLHLTRDKGIRVCFSSPNSLEESPKSYRKLRDAFQKLLTAAPLKTHYRLEAFFPGTKRIALDPNIEILSFWKKGKDIRIKVKDNRSKRIDPVSVGSFADYDPVPFQWIDFSNFKSNGKSPTPPEFDCQNSQINVQRSNGKNAHFCGRAFAAYTYRVGQRNKQTGLWQIPAKGNPGLIAEGDLSSPIITPDEQWAVFGRADKGWANANYLMRMHIPSRREQIVNLPEARHMLPLAYIEPFKKILIVEGQETVNPEYYLLDPEAGSTELVNGDFAPFGRIQDMPWQATGNIYEYWVGITDEVAKTTTIGRYSLNDFRFIPELKLPDIFISNYDGSCFWMDEPEKVLYLVYWDEIISVPVPW